jgi:hypothetical protein
MNNNRNIKVIIKRQDRIDYVIKEACKFYGVSTEEMFMRTKNPLRAQRKAIVVKLVRDIADVSFYEVACACRCSEGRVAHTYANITEDYHANVKIKELYDKIVRRLLHVYYL